MVLGLPTGKEALENSFWETLICKGQAKLKVKAMVYAWFIFWQKSPDNQIHWSCKLQLFHMHWKWRSLTRIMLKNWTKFSGIFYGQGNHTVLKKRYVFFQNMQVVWEW